MRIAFAGCSVLGRDVSRIIAESDNYIRPWWLRQGLHDTPLKLHEALMDTIRRIEEENEITEAPLRFDAIVLGYGLCANGIIGVGSRTLPIIAPRCDDCISLFLGSAERYRQLFTEYPGVYWYSRSWIETNLMPGRERYAYEREKFLQQFEDEETADYLMGEYNSWMRNYGHCCYISSACGDPESCIQLAKTAGSDYGWQYHFIEGNDAYMKKLLDGPWEDDAFLTCPPGWHIEADFEDYRKIKAVEDVSGSR